MSWYKQLLRKLNNNDHVERRSEQLMRELGDLNGPIFDISRSKRILIFALTILPLIGTYIYLSSALPAHRVWIKDFEPVFFKELKLFNEVVILGTILIASAIFQYREFGNLNMDLDGQIIFSLVCGAVLSPLVFMGVKEINSIGLLMEFYFVYTCALIVHLLSRICFDIYGFRPFVFISCLISMLTIHLFNRMFLIKYIDFYALWPFF